MRFHGRSIAQISALTVAQVADALASLELDEREAAVSRDLLPEIGNRLAFLTHVGLGYLSLDRGAPTLSGGEAQRIRLAAQLGSNLQGVCYVLDEPTIGLHPRDNGLLLDTLAALQARGNTVVVVEHDEETIRRAEHVIDLGPGAGAQGGYIVAEGTAAELAADPRFHHRPLPGSAALAAHQAAPAGGRNGHQPPDPKGGQAAQPARTAAAPALGPAGLHYRGLRLWQVHPDP